LKHFHGKEQSFATVLNCVLQKRKTKSVSKPIDTDFFNIIFRL